jgi:hypothetical protein
MDEATVVATFSTPEQGEAAVVDLKEAGLGDTTIVLAADGKETTVSVTVAGAQAAGAVEILDDHEPSDIDELAHVDGVAHVTTMPATAEEGPHPTRDAGISAPNLTLASLPPDAPGAPA